MRLVALRCDVPGAAAAATEAEGAPEQGPEAEESAAGKSERQERGRFLGRNEIREATTGPRRSRVPPR